MYVSFRDDDLTGGLTFTQGNSARQYVEAIGHREIAWLGRYAEALPPNMERWGASKGQNCP